MIRLPFNRIVVTWKHPFDLNDTGPLHDTLLTWPADI
jgi:hypothetical protein